MSASNFTRRDVLLNLGYGSALSCIPGDVANTASREPLSCETHVTSRLNDFLKAFGAEIGAAMLSAYPPDYLGSWTASEFVGLPTENLAELYEQLDVRVANDLRVGRFQHVGGWTVTNTEALLCAAMVQKELQHVC